MAWSCCFFHFWVNKADRKSDFLDDDKYNTLILVLTQLLPYLSFFYRKFQRFRETRKSKHDFLSGYGATYLYSKHLGR